MKKCGSTKLDDTIQLVHCYLIPKSNGGSLAISFASCWLARPRPRRHHHLHRRRLLLPLHHHRCLHRRLLPLRRHRRPEWVSVRERVCV